MELNLAENKIKSLKDFFGFPNVEDVNFSSNPIEMIRSDTFKEMKNLKTLNLTDIQLANTPDDFKFLKRCYNLAVLRLNGGFLDKDLIDFTTLPTVWSLEKLYLRATGLVRIDGIKDKFPHLQVLDV